MNVTHLLSIKGREVTTISPQRSVRDALDVLREHGIGALVVRGATAPFDGILSERDIVRALAADGAAALDHTVDELMTREVNVCEESTSLASLMTLMTEKRIRHVPVVRDGQLTGLVSIGDVVKARVDELERERRELLDYVSAR
jgi:CBS domain-containing protein